VIHVGEGELGNKINKRENTLLDRDRDKEIRDKKMYI
jgi:hypothetical protein